MLELALIRIVKILFSLPGSTGAASPGNEGTKKFLVSSINKALGTLVGTTTHWHVKNSRKMLTRQPNVCLLATAFANHESSRVTRKMIATPS